MKMIAGLVGWLALCQLPALVGMIYVQPNMAWYHSLVKPPLAPPDWLFGVVWGVLYVVLGVAAAIAFCGGVQKSARVAFWLFLVQLALNALWTPVYFGWHCFAGAALIIVLMLFEGIYLHRAFRRQSAVAAALLWPYWGWLVFATYLTIANWRLNG